MRQMLPCDNPFQREDANFDAVQKAKQLRQKSKIPRIRTMKKILKKIKESKQPKVVFKEEAKKDLNDAGLKPDV